MVEPRKPIDSKGENAGVLPAGRPIKRSLRPVFDDERKARVWRQVRARTMLARPSSRRPTVLLFAAAILLVTAAVVAAPWRAWLAPTAPETPSAPASASSSVAFVTSSAPITFTAPLVNLPDAGDPPAVDRVPPLASVAVLPTATVASDAAAPWRTLEAEGAHDRAYVALGPNGVADATRKASLDELFALADVARLSGHPKEAVAPLERVVREFPDDSRSSLAAFTLGRLYLGTMNDPASASWAFQRAIDRGVPGGLEEDAWASLVEAKSRAGDLAGARDAYAKASRKFPDGRRDAEMKRWIEPR